MRITDLARRYGVSRFTVYRWIKRGLIPAARTPGGRHIIGTSDEVAAMQTPITTNATLYLYIPLPKPIDVNAEVVKLQAFAESGGFTVDEVVIEGSGYDQYLRKLLLRILSQPTRRTLITNRASLPVGWKFVSTALAAAGRRLLVADAIKASDAEYRYQAKPRPT